MFNKLMLSALGLMAAVGGPMVYFAVSDYWKTGRVAAAASASSSASAAPAASPLKGPLPPTPDHSLAEVFQFGVTPDWIMRRWPQVATGLNQVQLQGYRVPLVSGTTESDVAGALTYYFNAQQQLQRIAFAGNTGDPRKLIVLLRSRYQLTWRPTNDPGLVVYEAVHSDNHPASALRIVTAPVVSAAEPRQRFELQLVLERPEE
jgi:hypothetical protein